MAITDSLKEAYFSLEDKWYSFVDGVSEKVPAFGGVIDTLEDKNIPTFPLVIILLLLLIVVIFLLIAVPSGSTLTVNVSGSDGKAIDGATVIIMQGSEQIEKKYSNSEGTVAFFLPNGQYVLKVQKDDYSLKTKDVTLSKNQEEDFTLSLEDAKVTKAVYLKNAQGSLIEDTGALTYRCKGTTEEFNATYASGKFEAEVNESCTEIEVLSMQKYNLVTTTASFSGNGAVTVEKVVVVTGNATVTLSIEGSSAAPPAGLKVALVPADGTIPPVVITQGTAIASFQNLSVQKYYVMVTDPDGNFQTYDGSKLGEAKDVTKDSTTAFTATLKKVESQKVTVTVKDKTSGSPISGATVDLALATNQNSVQTKISGATGQVVFSAAEGSDYILTVDHPDYVLGNATGLQAGDSKIVELEKVDSSNSNSLIIKVVDSKKVPIDGARVILKKVDPAQPVIGEKVTGSDGIADFYNLEVDSSYIATISKEGFGVANSTTMQVTPRASKTVEVVFDIADGTIKLKIMDPEKNPLSGVSVKAINYFTSAQEDTVKQTTTEGMVEFKIRGDKKVYFVVESTGYAKYFTVAKYPIPNGIDEREIVMVKPSSQLSAMPLTVYSGTSEVKSTGEGKDTVSTGVYEVKSVLYVPTGKFSEAGLHLRTGKQTQNITNTMEEDGLYISDVDSSGKITRGTTYTPPTGNSIDLKESNLTTGNAKWINSVWKNPQEGAYEVEAQVTVTETNPSAKISIYYRGWAKGSSILRDPAMSVAPSNELYADAKEKILSVGSGSVCSGSFCKSYTVQALSGSEAGRTKYISNTMEAKKDVQYLLTADLTNYSGKAIAGAALTVEGKSVDINVISINGAEQDDSTINLGTIGVDAPLQVQVLFTTVSSGTGAVKLTIASSTKTELEDSITVNVKANKVFSLKIIPIVIVPYINNSLFFEATDGNTMLDDVTIEIRSNSSLRGNVTTNGEGLATYELASPKIGDEISIKAMKEGYDSVELTKTVDDAIMTITPPSVEETIKIGDTTGFSTSVVMQNNTAKSLKIKKVNINGDMKTYLDVKFTSTIEGTIVDVGKDRNYSLLFKVNDTGMRLQEPKDVTGTITIETEITGANDTYLNELPVAIHITMPGFLDNQKCLKVNPTSLSFITSDTEESQTVTLSNECTAEGIEIPLHNVEAKLNEAAKYGTITLSGEGLKTISLSDAAAELTDYFEKQGEVSMTVRFSPNASIASGTQEFTITIDGKNVTDDGTEEKATASLKAETTMSILSKCIEIEKPEGGVVLQKAPWNMGYGRLAMSDLSSYASSYGGFTQRSSPYNMSYMGGMGMSGYGMGGYGSNYQNGFTSGAQTGTTALNYDQSQFIIKNNCAFDVDIDLDVDSRISASEEEFTLTKDSDNTITVQPGYVLGKYNIKVNAKPTGTGETKKKIGDISVTIKQLGETDSDCIKTNVTKISLNSVILRPEKYSVYNSCYDSGVQLSRSNVASIQCSAPKSTTGTSQPYLQMGYESQYASSYPLGGAQSSYYDYIGSGMGGMQQSGCPTNDCSLIQGTRAWYRTTTQGNTGTIERVDFQVFPSSEYVAQRKLFNSQSGTYGPFQTILDMRQWLTDADSRMNVYGKLNISYTNQYGSGQCMEFPIELEDIWRIGETIDSAVNWGDPNARPEDCQNANALDLISYWSDRGMIGGVIPDEKFTNGGTTYMHIAEPPALQIGPAPNQRSSIYPMYNMQYFQTRQQESTTKDSKKGKTASKNCGLSDSIEVITNIPAEKAGGAIIKIVETPNFGSGSSGSLLKNTRGPNLMLSINRSQMTANCIKLEMPISAKVSRTISFEDQELTWVLRVLFTKQGVPYTEGMECKTISLDASSDCQEKIKAECLAKGIKSTDTAGIKAQVEDFLKRNPSCKAYVSETTAAQLIKEAEGTTGTADACGTDSNIIQYGFDKISKLTLKTIDKDSLDNYCSQYFCNSDQIEGAMYNRLRQIKAVEGDLSAQCVGNENIDLNELYKLAGKVTTQACAKADINFFKSELTKGIIVDKYTIPQEFITDPKVVEMIKTAPDAAGDTGSISAMKGILEKIYVKEGDAMVLEVDKNDEHTKQFKDLNMVEVEGTSKWYLPLANYIKLAEIMDKKQYDSTGCASASGTCTISNSEYSCNKAVSSITITAKAMNWISTQSVLKKGILEKNNQDINSQERVYLENPKLNNIHKLAVMNSDRNKLNNSIASSAYLTKVTKFEKPATGVFTEVDNALASYNIKFMQETAEVGAYSVELKYNICARTKSNDANVEIKRIGDVLNAPKAKDNILLTSGYATVEVKGSDALDNAIGGAIIIENAAKQAQFYKRVPVRMDVTLYGGESSFGYKPQSLLSSAPSLINWYFSTGTLKGKDAKGPGGYYGIQVVPQSGPQSLKGIYYYPEEGVLAIPKGNATGGTITATAKNLFTATASATIPTGQLPNSKIELTGMDFNPEAGKVTLEVIVEQVNAQNACPTPSGIFWNEAKILK